MIIILLTGLALSGKDSVADYLVKKYGFKKLVYSEDIIKPELIKRKLPINKMNYSIIGDKLRKEFGMNVLAKKLWKKMKNNSKGKFVLPGTRSIEEVEFFKQKNKNTLVWAIKSNLNNRMQRMHEKYKADVKTFQKRDERDIKLKGLGKVIEIADKVIENNESLQELFKKTDSLIKKTLLKKNKKLNLF